MTLVKYVALYTGYDYRLYEIYSGGTESCQWSQEQVQALKDTFSVWKPIKLPNTYQRPIILDQEEYDRLDPLFQENECVIFKIPENEANYSNLIQMLSKVQYCGRFGTIDNISIVANDTILLIEMDCESG